MGGWLETIVLALKWKIDIAIFWPMGQEVELRFFPKRAEGSERPRGAVLYNGCDHYDALSLSSAAWALVDVTS